MTQEIKQAHLFNKKIDYFANIINDNIFLFCALTFPTSTDNIY